MSKIIVTGGAGFIGSNFIHYWLEKHPEDEIFNVDKLTYAGNLENLKEVESNPKYHFIKADINDKSSLDHLIKSQKINKIVHFAAETHVDRSILDPSVFVTTNVLGTQTLLELARTNNIEHFHHISTDEVFGSIEKNEDWKFNEKTPYNPRSPYSASKAASDMLVKSYHTTFGLPVTITNCSNNYGPRLFPEKLISLAITNLLEGKKVPVYGAGDQSRDWLYVSDHASAIDAVISKGKVGETYCVGGMDSEITNLEVVKKICQLLGKDPEQNIEFVKDRAGHDFKYVIDWSKIKNELGWKPQYDFDQGLKKTVDWYVANTEWWKKIKSGEYTEYYTKQYQNR
jgi:dTDP-glucose 4,6-dehydratase